MRVFTLLPMYIIPVCGNPKRRGVRMPKQTTPQVVGGRYGKLDPSRRYTQYKVFGLKAVRVEAQ